MKRSIFMKVHIGIVVMTIVLCLIALAIIWDNESEYRSTRQKLSQMSLVGTYSLNDQMETFELNQDTEFKLKGINSITVKGHFTEEVSANMKVMLRIENLKVHIKINGETVYSFGEYNKYVDYAKSGGNLWDSFTTLGIEKSDLVEVRVTNLYTNRVSATFNSFFQNICFGNETQYSREVLRAKLGNCFRGMVVLIMGIFATVFGYVSYRLRQPTGILTCFSGLSICAGIWIFIDFEIQNTLFPSPVFNNVLEVMTTMLTSYFALCFIAQHLTCVWRNILRINAFGFIVAIIVAIPLQFMGILDYYEIYPVMYVLGGSGAAFTIMAVIYEQFLRKREKCHAQIAASSSLLALAAAVDLWCIYTDGSSRNLWFKWAVIVFLLVEFIEIVHTFRGYIVENMRVNILEEMAYKDALTGVKNRTAYLEKIRKLEECEQGEAPEFAVFVFDINNLKTVNDTMGHDHGDHLIQDICKSIDESFGKNGLYRIGGDEFVVILEGKKSRNYKQIMQEFIELCKKQKMQIACGSALYEPKEDRTFDDIFSRADKAMYEMKKRMKRQNNM